MDEFRTVVGQRQLLSVCVGLVVLLCWGCASDREVENKASRLGESCEKSQDCEDESRCVENVCVSDSDKPQSREPDEAVDEPLTETEAQPDPPEKTAAEEVKEPDASRGFLMVDGQKVNVPFPVAHTLFNFTQAMVTAKDHREACGRKGKSRRRQADCDHGRWFGLLDNKEAGKPFYLEPRGSERVRQIILHATMTRNVPDAIRLMVGHAVSTHVMIDSDGTVYQVADLALTAHHMTNHNETSIGVDLVSPMPNLTNWNPRKDYQLAPEPHLEKLTLRRPIATFQLRGRTIRSRGPTSAQQTSLTAVCKALVRTFPTIKRKVPRDGAGKVMFDTLENPTHFSGILGHFHTSPTRWDPGPGIDWDALEKAIQ